MRPHRPLLRRQFLTALSRARPQEADQPRVLDRSFGSCAAVLAMAQTLVPVSA
jgi:hypothetical protein